jgi:hypothetical protein
MKNYEGGKLLREFFVATHILNAFALVRGVEKITFRP